VHVYNNQILLYYSLIKISTITQKEIGEIYHSLEAAGSYTLFSNSPQYATFKDARRQTRDNDAQQLDLLNT